MEPDTLSTYPVGRHNLHGTIIMSATLMGESVSQAQVNGLVEEVFPQGCWGDDAYLWLTDHTRRLVELTDGYLEILPMPSRGHQRILAFLYSAFHAFLRSTGGEVLFAPLRLRIRQGKFREPDLLVVRDARDARSGDRFWTGADAVVEVISPDRPRETSSTNVTTTPKRQSRNTGSSIRRRRPSPSSRWEMRDTSRTVCTVGVAAQAPTLFLVSP